jgi:hypothetical protein
MAITQPRLTLYRGFLEQGHYTWSPFVTKIEARLRFAGLTYETQAGSLRTAPRGKIPYLEVSQADSPASRIISDSTLIIKDLVKDELVADINACLNASERTYDLALRALLEDRLYFLLVSAFLPHMTNDAPI